MKIAAAAVHVGGINELAYFYRPRDQVANYIMLQYIAKVSYCQERNREP